MAEIQIQDNINRTVRLSSPAQRIVSLSPHTTELVYAAGAGSSLIAVDSYSDFPEAVLGLPRIGATSGLDREKLLQLQPDLVIAWASGNKASDLHWLAQAGIPVYQSEPKTLNDIALTLIDIGALAGTSETARRAAATFHANLAAVCSDIGKNDAMPVYYEIWPHPAMTIGGQHWLNEALQLAGMKNVFADQPRAILAIEAEAALSRPYQLKIVNPGTIMRSASAKTTPTTVIPGNLLLDRPGPRIFEGIKQICQESL